jgi:rRNA-processing protein FCF1
VVSKVIFPDTNIFLHWPFFTDMDWHGIVGADEVHLIIASIVFYEVEKHKDTNKKHGVKKRALKTIQKLEEMGAEREGGVELNSTFKVEVQLEDVPTEDFTSGILSRQVADDRIVAAALAMQKIRPQHECVIVSGDTALRMKARRKGIEAIAPPANLRESDNEEETDLGKALKENADLKVRMPKPVAEFKTGGNRFEWPNHQPLLQEDTFVHQRLKAIRKGHPKKDESKGVPFSMSLPGQSSKEMREYNEELDEYYDQIQTFLRKGYQRRLRILRTPKLDLVLNNIGTGKASHARITLAVGKSLSFLNQEDYPAEEEPPKEPHVPGSHFLQTLGNTRSYDEFKIRTKPIGLNDRFQISEDRKEATFEIENLIHGAPKPLPQLMVVREDDSEPKSFSVNWSLSCAELMAPANGKLNVTMGIEPEAIKNNEFEAWLNQRYETEHEVRVKLNPELWADFD